MKEQTVSGEKSREITYGIIGFPLHRPIRVTVTATPYLTGEKHYSKQS